MSDFPEAAFRFFAALPRQGPGSEADTRAVLSRLPPLPADPSVIDVGCGTGASARVLAADLGARVRAFDLAPILLAVLVEKAREAGLAERIEAIEADMAALPVEPGTIDLLWAESSIYNLGLGEGLRLWRPLLADNGIAVVSDAVWRVPDPPAPARDLWQTAYPPMSDAAAAIAAAEGAGYDVLFTHWLSHEGWAAYFEPMERALAAGDHGLSDDFVAGLEQEIAVWRNHGDAFGYLFLALRVAKR